MPILYDNTSSCNFNIITKDGKVNIPLGADIVEEIDLIGERTLVPRFGFSSNAVEYDIWLIQSEYNKLIAMRNAQNLNNKILYDGNYYSLTIISDISMMLTQTIYFLKIRLKRI